MDEKDIRLYFSHEVINSMALQISSLPEKEFFFLGKTDSAGLVSSVSEIFYKDENPFASGEEREFSVLINCRPDGKLAFPFQDEIFFEGEENHLGFYVIDRDLKKVLVVKEPSPNEKIKMIGNLSAGCLCAGGELSRISDSFEERPAQIKLLEKIANTFDENGIGVFEAGTGVGKSYAYLIPAMLWATENNRRVVISTGTINLQQQLCEKDIPMAEKIISKKVKHVLVKGRQNFVCKRRFFDVVSQRELFDDAGIMENLSDWVEKSESGSRSDLPFVPPESIWTRINSESDACMGHRCPFYAECFVMKMKKEAASASIVVVNHHLLFADIEARLSSGSYDDAAVLPPYKHIIFDEAHGIESAATSFFSEAFSRFKLIRQLSALYRKRKSSESGYLCTLSLLSSSEERIAEIAEGINRIKNDIVNLETASLDLLEEKYSIRLCDSTFRGFSAVLSLASTLSKSVGNLSAIAREIMDGVPEGDREIPVFWETRLILRRLEDVCVLLNDFSKWDEKKEAVFWIQKKMVSADFSREGENPLFVIFNKTPLEIGSLMNSGVFEPMDSVVCTSATLRTGSDFGYWMRRTGVSFAEKERVRTGFFPSPFMSEKNMLFAVPSDAPFPDDARFQPWIEAAIVKLIRAADGRTLVLFTSYDSLKSAYDFAQRRLSDNFDGMILRQGGDDNARLLGVFKKDEKSVLFATDSFWQGVDVPGKSLSQVIIVKLPFSVPNDPVFTARAESIQKKGGSSFMELSLPEAIIKFRQGVGRLLRRGDDRGAVVALDRRLYGKAYGSLFIQGVGECKKIYDSIEKIAEKVSDFIFDRIDEFSIARRFQCIVS